MQLGSELFDRALRTVLAVTLLTALLAGSPSRAEPAVIEPVDGTRIANSDVEARNWLSYGRTYSEQRYSPLRRINVGSAKSLGLVWFADLDTNRGQEATPLVVDGIVYISTAWSLVKAYDGRSGRLLWSYDPSERGWLFAPDVQRRLQK